MKYLLLILTTFSYASFAVENQVTICKYGNNERKIEVVYPEATETPCEVQYTKGAVMQVLWSATAELYYCAEKAAAFVEKQKGWGWQCEIVEKIRPMKINHNCPGAEANLLPQYVTLEKSVESREIIQF